MSKKENVGWWKIVMLVLTCVITLALTLTAVFVGLGVVQIKRIADIPQNITGMIEDFDYFAPDEEYDDDYYSEDEINWDDLFSFFDSEDTDSQQNTPGGKEKGSDKKENSNSGDRTNSADTGEYGNGSDAFTDEEWENMLSEWITSIFGGSSDSGTQGF